MNPRVRPSFDSAVYWALLVNAPALLIALGCAYAGVRVSPFLFFGTAVMGLVFAANLFTQLRQVKRAAALVAKARPVDMLLTADAGWSAVRLRPVRPDAGLPTISNIHFVTRLSGVPRAAQQDTPVEVYLDPTDPDIVVMRIGDRLLSSDITFRYAENGSAPRREYAQPDAAVIPRQDGVQGSSVLNEGIAKIAAENQLHITIVSIAGGVAFVFGMLLTGTWQLVTLWIASGSLPSLSFDASLLNAIFPLLILVAFALIIRRLLHTRAMLSRAQAVVRHARPTPQPLQISALPGTSEGSVSWLATISPADAPAYTVSLLGNMDKARAKTLSGAIAQVYATPQRHDPVVIQTVDGILIGERKGVPAQPAGAETS